MIRNNSKPYSPPSTLSRPRNSGSKSWSHARSRAHLTAVGDSRLRIDQQLRKVPDRRLAPGRRHPFTPEIERWVETVVTERHDARRRSATRSSLTACSTAKQPWSRPTP
jgi:hypothetical protein